MSSWHNKDISEVSLEFGTDVNNGKINVNPERKRRGDNCVFLLPSVDSRAVVKRLVSDASFALLAVVYVISAILGRIYESVFGMLLLMLVFVLAFSIKYSSSKRIVNSYKLLLPFAKVVENGKNIRLSTFDVEPGDLIEFSQGDIIPADARIVSSTSLIVAERYYDFNTGKIAYRREEKNSEKIADYGEAAETYANMLYAASMVVSGKGKAIVTATGNAARFSGTESAMRVVSTDDAPAYVTRFSARAKLTSLFAFFAVIPMTFIISALRSAENSADNGFSLLYIFLVLLSLSVTCMSELVIMPADALLTKELLVSSRSGKAKKYNRSRLTKLSSADMIADTDTVLILNPNVMSDTAFSVRRIYFSGKQFRFDTLKSSELASFAERVYPSVKLGNPTSDELLALKVFFEDTSTVFNKDIPSNKPKILRNFPIDGAKSCVFETDERGKPLCFLAYSKSLDLLKKCVSSRSEGGATWVLDNEERGKILSVFEEYYELGLKVLAYYSSESENGELVFEGLVACGQECPFTDGTLIEEFSVSGIHPILYYEKENDHNVSHAMNCGLVANSYDIVLASDYRRNGLSINDAPLTAKVYIGFGREGVAALTARLIANSRNVLPIVKESADRRAVSPLRVYATLANNSHDSVIISSSISLRPADAETRRGGLADALDLIRGCSMARLKLGVYRNYLAFSTFFRIAAVCGALMFSTSGKYLSSVMVLIMGFLCDAVALFSIMASKGIPVNPKVAVADSKQMFSPSLCTSFAVIGFISGIVALVTSELAPRFSVLPVASTASMLTLSAIVSQIVAIGGFLIVLNKHSKRATHNLFYIVTFIALCAFVVFQAYGGGIIFASVQPLNIFSIDISALPFAALSALVALGGILLISRLISTFSGSVRN